MNLHLDRPATERGEWQRWLAGAVLGITLTLAGSALVRVMSHENRLTTGEERIKALEEADRLIRADLARDHDENRKALADIQADIKKLLERGK